MNATDQAKNSFKTFLVTLVVSLVLFGSVYFVASNYGQTVDIESSGFEVEQYNEEIMAEEEKDQVAGVFGELSQQDISESQSNVLGAADVPETTQSTVPSTGISGITYAFIFSISSLILGFYLMIWNPRRRALALFENRVRRQL